MNVLTLAENAGTILAENLGPSWHIRASVDQLPSKVRVHVYQTTPEKATTVIGELGKLAGGITTLARGVGADAGTFTLYVDAS